MIETVRIGHASCFVERIRNLIQSAKMFGFPHQMERHVNTTTVHQITSLETFRPNFSARFRAWRNRPRPVTVQSILSAAETGHLSRHLNAHYTICYDKHWQANLTLCRDLVDAGYLTAEFDEHFDGVPLFINDDARITIAGRDYLANLRRNQPVRRVVIGGALFVSGVFSKTLVAYVTSLLS